MTAITSFTLFLSLLAVATAIGALIVTFRGSAAHLSKQLRLLSEAHAELVSTVEQVQLALRNLRSQVNMQTYRAKQKTEELPTDPTDEDAKARVRRELGAQFARGQLSANKPGV